ASTAKETRPLWLCPNCGGPMVVMERITAGQFWFRSPPFLSGSAPWNNLFQLSHSVPLTPRRRGAPCLPPNQLSVPNLDPKSRSHHTQTLTQPILASLLPAPVPVPQASLLTPTIMRIGNTICVTPPHVTPRANLILAELRRAITQ